MYDPKIAGDTQLATRFCENLGHSVILYRTDSSAADTENKTDAPSYQCLSSHLCGEGSCKPTPPPLM